MLTLRNEALFRGLRVSWTSWRSFRKCFLRVFNCRCILRLCCFNELFQWREKEEKTARWRGGGGESPDGNFCRGYPFRNAFCAVTLFSCLLKKREQKLSRTQEKCNHHSCDIWSTNNDFVSPGPLSLISVTCYRKCPICRATGGWGLWVIGWGEEEARFDRRQQHSLPFCAPISLH